MRYSFVYICEKRKLIYYDVPKCASSTIRKELFGNDNALSMINPKRDLKEYFKFTFVRNPWDRMVSNWKMFTSQASRIKQLKSMTSQDVSKFEDFVYFANRIRNHHWQPQVLYLPEKMDFIGRFEAFERDFERLCFYIGEKPWKVAKLNVTKRGPYYKYYTPSLVNYVAEIYSEDIRKFGYKFKQG
jgi:hypothetical protein